MLVPDMRVKSGAGFFLSRVADRAARMETPGAQRSGFNRPSRVGPQLLKDPSFGSDLCLLYAPTANVRLPLQIVPVVDLGSASSARKCD